MAQSFDVNSGFWDDTRFPIVNLGPLRFPAFFMPLAGSLIFIFIKTYRAQDRALHAPRRRRVIQVPAEGIVPAAAPDLDRFAALSLDLFHSYMVWNVLRQGKLSWYDNEPMTVLCLSEAVALVLDSAIFCRSDLIACSSAALGWVCLIYRHDLSEIHKCFLVLLALPCAWQVPGSTQTGARSSGMLLLAYACDGLIAPTAKIREYRTTRIMEDWLLVLWLGSAFIADSVKNLRSAEAHSNASVARIFFTGFPTMIACLATLLSSLVAAVCVTGLAFSSLNWRYLVLSLPSHPPSLDGGALFGGQLALVTAITLMYMRKGESRCDHFDWEFICDTLSLFIDSTGWAVVMFVAVWAGLTAWATNNALLAA